MPNVALLLGAGLIGALFAGIYLLYSEDGFSNFHSYSNNQTPPPRSPPNTSRSQRFGTPSGSPSKRKKRIKKEESDCVICCDEIFSYNSQSLLCGHEFHIKCIQKWIREQQYTNRLRMMFKNIGSMMEKYNHRDLDIPPRITVAINPSLRIHELTVHEQTELPNMSMLDRKFC